MCCVGADWVPGRGGRVDGSLAWPPQPLSAAAATNTATATPRRSDMSRIFP